MLIAFFSDIHANLPALEAAIADARKRRVSRMYCAGDIIGYGPFPNEVCDLLQASNIQAITGNYDVKVLNAIKDSSSAADLQKKKQKILLWTAGHLSHRNQKYLANLPDHLDLEFSGRKVLLVHGTPADNDDDIYPSITDRGLKSKIGESRADILVCGHTHVPFVKKIAGVLVVNCGSVGQPVDGDPRLGYAVISIDDAGAAHASIFRVEYDVNRIIETLEGTSLPKVLRKDLASGSKRMFLR